MPSSKCPKCDASLSELNVSPLTLRETPRKTYKGIAYTCPRCNSLVSSGPDFLAQAEHIADLVLQKLRS